ncbi:hypothetical protein, partial [Xanthomonas fragariae]
MPDFSISGTPSKKIRPPDYEILLYSVARSQRNNDYLIRGASGTADGAERAKFKPISNTYCDLLLRNLRQHHCHRECIASTQSLFTI